MTEPKLIFDRCFMSISYSQFFGLQRNEWKMVLFDYLALFCFCFLVDDLFLIVCFSAWDYTRKCDAFSSFL